MQRTLVALVLVLSLAACATSKPVLYPNAHLQSTGKDVAEKDIEACEEMAEGAGAKEGTGKAGQVAGSTAVGAGIGAASGAVGGAVVGAAGSGSAIGAAGGAVAGLLGGLFNAMFTPSGPNPTYANFVNRCLLEKGYELVGWQ